MTDKSILLEKNNKSGVAILTLNRPDQFNAFNREMVNLWADTLIDITSDKNIRAMVLTGAGKAFCAGGDMDELDSFLTMNMSERKSFLFDNVYRVMRQVHSMDIPIIAALNGTARGAGVISVSRIVLRFLRNHILPWALWLATAVPISCHVLSGFPRHWNCFGRAML